MRTPPKRRLHPLHRRRLPRHHPRHPRKLDILPQKNPHVFTAKFHAGLGSNTTANGDTSSAFASSAARVSTNCSPTSSLAAAMASATARRARGSYVARRRTSGSGRVVMAVTTVLPKWWWVWSARAGEEEKRDLVDQLLGLKKVGGEVVGVWGLEVERAWVVQAQRKAEMTKKGEGPRVLGGRAGAMKERRRGREVAKVRAVLARRGREGGWGGIASLDRRRGGR